MRKLSISGVLLLLIFVGCSPDNASLEERTDEPIDETSESSAELPVTAPDADPPSTPTESTADPVLENNTQETVSDPTDEPSGNVNVSPNAIEIKQDDGTTLHVIGQGNMVVSYTETTDGYTLVRNKDNVYEYAELNSRGDLVPSGTKATDPGTRDEREKKYLSKIDKHLKYKSPKLDELLKEETPF